MSSCVVKGWWWLGGRGGGSVWIHLLLLLHIYTLPVTDKTSHFQDHVNIVYKLASFKTMGGRGRGKCLDPSPAPAPHLHITSH